MLIRVVDLGFGTLLTTNRRIFWFDVWEPDEFHPVVVLIWKWEPDDILIRLSFQNKKWQPDEYVIRFSFPNKMTFFLNDNRMRLSSDCHFILKWQQDECVIWLSFYFEMTTGCGVIRFFFYFKMTTGWHTHSIVFFLKCEPDGGAIRFYFFVHVNRIVTVVELKFCIGVLEEYIRVQEEFVFLSCIGLSFYPLEFAGYGLTKSPYQGYICLFIKNKKVFFSILIKKKNFKWKFI